MRAGFGILLVVILVFLIYKLDTPTAGLPALGRFLDPVSGCLANAESTEQNFSLNLKLDSIHGDARVWFDKRLVPHVHCNNELDLYYLEGYLHAYFRLWQMDMETRAAAGRVSEVIGKKGVQFDRLQRRKGMIFAAEQSLSAMEKDPRTKLMADAYTEGINEYIRHLNYRDYPFEYKLMGFKPEPWTNIKSALLLKYMADDLTGASDDIPLTYLREVLSPEVFQLLYPVKIKDSKTVIPAGTEYGKPSLPRPKVPIQNVFPHFTKVDFRESRQDGIGSNNWAVNGNKTKSGSPILCNDPHLALHLPSLWYEMQLQSPEMNVYGVSLPGAPGIIIGFNDSIAWGLTNNYRDVKDFYLIKPVDSSRDKYWFDGQELVFKKRIEHILIRGEKEFTDTVKYTVHGPVTYEQTFPAEGGLHQPLAVDWMAYRPTNELLAIYMLNRSNDYQHFVAAIGHFECPAQNMLYADKGGNIGIWGQGSFVNKWKDQGRFIMDGSTSEAMWQQMIPVGENPHAFNPAQGYLVSANQNVTDSMYPYWYNGNFVEFRAWRLNQVLDTLRNITVKDMFALQNDTYSLLAAQTLPIMLKHLPAQYSSMEKAFVNQLRNWDCRLVYNGHEATIYQIWWYYLYHKIWAGFSNVPAALYPLPERTMQLLQQADAGKIDIKEFAKLDDLIAGSFKQTCDSIAKLKSGTEWYLVKNTTVSHLSRLPALSFSGLEIGGWGNTVNAAKTDHGPSWRMVVQLGKEIEAYGVYPGGQSGNPGSKYYADFLADWAAGKYYKLLFLANSTQQNSNELKYTWTIHR